MVALSTLQYPCHRVVSEAPVCSSLAGPGCRTHTLSERMSVGVDRLCTQVARCYTTGRGPRDAIMCLMFLCDCRHVGTANKECVPVASNTQPSESTDYRHP